MNYILVLTFISAFLRLGWADNVRSNSENTGLIEFYKIPDGTDLSYCVVPPQPSNGRWKLHRSLCDTGLDCDIPQSIALKSGSQLVYSCDPGFRAEGNTDVYCVTNGNWSSIPKCVEIKCPEVNTASIQASCYDAAKLVKCNSPILPQTTAIVSCRPGYRKDTNFLLMQGENVTCNDDGKWVPDPIKCVPDCGTLNSTSDLWWRATIYEKIYTSGMPSMKYLCGGTIIRANLVLTALHCVSSVVYQGSFYVTTGKDDYEKIRVKNVHGLHSCRQCPYEWLTRHSSLDIALLELEQPFVLSKMLLPACLDLEGSSEQLRYGAFVAIPAFWKSDAFNETLKIAEEIYLAERQCDYFLAEAQFGEPMKNDQFCTGVHNGQYETGRHEGDGLVFVNNKRWYVMGILNSYVSRRNTTKKQYMDHFSIYTKVSHYMPWILDVINRLERSDLHHPWNPDLSLIETTSSKPPKIIQYTNIEASSNFVGLPCTVPPQPKNGEWRFHGYPCTGLETSELKAGSELVYSCAPGFKMSGNYVVFCRCNGTWSDIPDCIEVKCEPLNSISTVASCSHSGKKVSCNSPVPIKTRAQVSCSLGYKKDTDFIATRKEIVTCSEDGKWKPDPIRCLPVCGVQTSRQAPLILHGTVANIGDFPWHATLYLETQSYPQIYEKTFICGATIIHSNFIMTAAHCVYNHGNETTVDPTKLFVTTGNTFRDYYFADHDPSVVRRAKVKYVYTHSSYYGLYGNFHADIALLELQEPFSFSSILSPACLDLEGYSEQILEPDVFGRVAGFGITATGNTSAVLQTLSIPFVSKKQCKTSTIGRDSRYLISNDNFCAGFTNGTALCDGDSGGGLVFPIYDLWYVLGIVSVSLGVDLTNGERKCDKSAYTLFTKVSSHLEWIQEVISDPGRYRSTQLNSPPSTSNVYNIQYSEVTCTAPPQPDNGEWTLYLDPARNHTNFNTLQNGRIRQGDRLVYSCFPGYKISGNTYVYCVGNKAWSDIPNCVETKCNPLTSILTVVSCSRGDKSLNCDSPVPSGTRAQVSCFPGFKKDTTSMATRNEIVFCAEDKKWKPDPIKCVPDCGVAIKNHHPLVISEATAKTSEFPWYAALYLRTNSLNGRETNFICGGTIIHSNFVLTAAHCVYNEILETAKNPENFFVLTGNLVRDYNSPLHNPATVKKASIKNVYVHSNYYARKGNYASDIAILELQQPFNFSAILLPACLDLEGYSEEILEPGVYGRVASFERTATTESSAMLKTLTLPYISYRTCKAARFIDGSQYSISNDKFCAGYTNGTALCDDYGGGRLVFQYDRHWYVLGIVSVDFAHNLDNGQKTCNRYSYSVFTKVSTYLAWIRDVISNSEQSKIY